jgi:hypothetical protein
MDACTRYMTAVSRLTLYTLRSTLCTYISKC